METWDDYIKGEQCATWGTSIPIKFKLADKLIEQGAIVVYDDRQSNSDCENSVILKIPKRWMRDPKPPKQISDKQREAARERLKEARKKIND